jgi:DNA-binding transcriptional ArsR family regulator
LSAKNFSRNEQVDLLTLTNLEQVRVLADPLRIRIVEKLCDDEHTTKQVAEALGEKPTKLYHHVEALEKVGLIRQTRTKRNRGTLERYYLSVARRFNTEAALFAGDDSPPAAEALQSIVATILETTGRELSELSELAAGHDGKAAEECLLSFIYLEADQKTITRLQRRMKKLLTDIQALDDRSDRDEDDGPKMRKYRLTLAFYPLDHEDGSAS